jgi:hypothetical protein
MPTAIAVRNAKETMAASTLSLILRVILLPPAGMSRSSGAVDAAPSAGRLRRLLPRAKQKREKWLIHLDAVPRVSEKPHSRGKTTT